MDISRNYHFQGPRSTFWIGGASFRLTNSLATSASRTESVLVFTRIEVATYCWVIFALLLCLSHKDLNSKDVPSNNKLADPPISSLFSQQHVLASRTTTQATCSAAKPVPFFIRQGKLFKHLKYMYSLCPISPSNIITKFRSTNLSFDYVLLIFNLQIKCNFFL